jgi:hypothetical protein
MEQRYSISDFSRKNVEKLVDNKQVIKYTEEKNTRKLFKRIKLYD